MKAIIYKYQVTIDGPAEIPWTFGSKVTAVQVRKDPAIVDVWVHYPDRDAPSTKRVFQILPTGIPFSENLEVVGTTIVEALGVVWHVAAEFVGPEEPHRILTE